MLLCLSSKQLLCATMWIPVPHNPWITLYRVEQGKEYHIFVLYKELTESAPTGIESTRELALAPCYVYNIIIVDKSSM